MMKEEQGILNLAFRYTRALSRWIRAGRPVRSEEEIKQIFEIFCLPCEAYEEPTSSCLYCGCRVNRTQAAMMNKIAMATEECPLGNWGVVEDDSLQTTAKEKRN
jgi:hypothetical protein